MSATVASVQPLPSRQLVLMQLCDVLLGAAAHKMNGTGTSAAKAAIIARIESRLNRELKPTPKSEEKFNVFKIQLQGGW